MHDSFAPVSAKIDAGALPNVAVMCGLESLRVEEAQTWGVGGTLCPTPRCRNPVVGIRGESGQFAAVAALAALVRAWPRVPVVALPLAASAADAEEVVVVG